MLDIDNESDFTIRPLKKVKSIIKTENKIPVCIRCVH